MNIPCAIALGITFSFVELLPAATHKETFGPEVIAEVYKHASGDDLWIYRFQPEYHDPSVDRRPAVVFFFGGGWNGGSVHQFEKHATYLAQRGIVAFLADYRVKNRQGVTPDDCVRDGKSAVRWIRVNASRLGVDPEKIAAGGGSAGGHVAASAVELRRFWPLGAQRGHPDLGGAGACEGSRSGSQRAAWQRSSCAAAR